MKRLAAGAGFLVAFGLLAAGLNGLRPYVLEGAFTLDEPGKPRRTFQVGELYAEPIGTPMQARNLSASETKILVFQVSGHGEPLMYKAD